MVARRRFVFAEKMYRRLAAEAGVHSTTTRARMLAAGDEAAHLPARSVDGRVWPGSRRPEVIAQRDAQICALHAGGMTIADIIRGVGCCRDTVVKVLRAAGRR